jgi:membrane fusion protein, heavy metal efflux system
MSVEAATIPATAPPEATAGARRRAHLWLIGVLAAGLVAALGTAIDLARRPAASRPPMLVLAPATRGQVVGTVRAAGRVEAANTVALTQPIAGRLIRVAAEAGDRVVRGQVLARFDPLPLRADLARAEARMVAAEAAAYEAELKLGQVVRRLEGARGRRYPQPDESDEETSDLAALAEIAHARTSSAMAEVAARETALRLEYRRLSRSEVRAPAAGFVQSREVEEGQVVAAGTPLFRFTPEPTRLQAAVSIPELHMAEVKVGQEVVLTAPAFPGRRFAGRIARLLPVRDRPDAVRLPVVISFEAPGELRPGMTIEATIRTPGAEGAWRVPTAALFFAPRSTTAPADDPAVWIASDDGLALTRQPVEVGAMDGAFTELRTANLRDGDRVAIGQATGR